MAWFLIGQQLHKIVSCARTNSSNPLWNTVSKEKGQYYLDFGWTRWVNGVFTTPLLVLIQVSSRPLSLEASSAHTLYCSQANQHQPFETKCRRRYLWKQSQAIWQFVMLTVQNWSHSGVTGEPSAMWHGKASQQQWSLIARSLAS